MQNSKGGNRLEPWESKDSIYKKRDMFVSSIDLMIILSTPEFDRNRNKKHKEKTPKKHRRRQESLPSPSPCPMKSIAFILEGSTSLLSSSTPPIKLSAIAATIKIQA